MRGGAIPLAAWGVLLVILLAINWLWTSDTIQVACFGFAAGAVFLGAVLLLLASRGEAGRRGPPPLTEEIDAIPMASVGAAAVGVAVAAILLGLAYGRFLIYFGGGLLVASIGRVISEVRQERRAQRAIAERRAP